MHKTKAQEKAIRETEETSREQGREHDDVEGREGKHKCPVCGYEHGKSAEKETPETRKAQAREHDDEE